MKPAWGESCRQRAQGSLQSETRAELSFPTSCREDKWIWGFGKELKQIWRSRRITVKPVVILATGSALTLHIWASSRTRHVRWLGIYSETWSKIRTLIPTTEYYSSPWLAIHMLLECVKSDERGQWETSTRTLPVWAVLVFVFHRMYLEERFPWLLRHRETWCPEKNEGKQEPACVSHGKQWGRKHPSGRQSKQTTARWNAGVPVFSKWVAP